MLAAVNRDPASPEAFDGLFWIYEKTKRMERETAAKFLEVMMEHHAGEPEMGRIASWISYADNSNKTEENLLKILEHNKSESVQASAIESLIKHYQAVKLIKDDSVLRGYALKSLDEEGIKYIDSRSREELNALMDKYFKLGMEKYGDVKVGRSTFGDSLKPLHFEHSRLQVGMEAPDIVGEDIDGVDFKLSEYRGKVVMINFWGDW